MKCFYHNDLDGKAAAFCVHAWVGIHDLRPRQNLITVTNGKTDIAQFIPINYNQLFPLDTIIPGEQVWIVDYSIAPEEMQALLDITDDVTWIDHHKTAIDRYADFPREIRGVRRDGEAGCVLAWKYIHWWTARGDGPIDITRDCPYHGLEVPEAIELVGDRDIWAWKRGSTTRFFYAGASSHNTDPDSDFWFQCLEHETEDAPPPNTGNALARERGLIFWDRLLKDGEAIERYRACWLAERKAAMAYETEIDGHRAIAMNIGGVGSEAFGDERSYDEYPVRITYYHTGSEWLVSLYARDVDVSVIAKSFGGGGHRGASGFTCHELPFSLLEK